MMDASLIESNSNIHTPSPTSPTSNLPPTLFRMRALRQPSLPLRSPAVAVKRWARPTIAARCSADWRSAAHASLEALLDQLASAEPSEQHVALVDSVLKELSQSQASAGHLSRHHADPEARRDALEAYLALRQLELQLCDSDALREPLLSGASSPAAAHLRRCVLSSLLLSGTRAASGYAVGWDEAQRQQLLQRHREEDRGLLAELERLWLSGEASPTVQLEQADVTGDAVMAAALQRQQPGPGRGGACALRLDLETAEGLLQRHPDASIRQQVCEMALGGRLGRTAALLARLAQARSRVAHHYGFPCYAELAQQLSLSGGPAGSVAFLEQLAAAIRPHAERELAGLCGAQERQQQEQEHQEQQQQQQQQQQLQPAGVTAAEWEYLRHRGQQEAAEEEEALAGEELQQHLQLDGCVAGASRVLEQLLGVRLQPQEVAAPEAWVPGLRKYALVQAAAAGEEGQRLGTLFIDVSAGYGTQMLHFGALGVPASAPASPRPRPAGAATPGRRRQAAAPDLWRAQGLPVVAIGLQSGGQLGGAALHLGLWELLHELGHALHFLLSAQRCQRLHLHACRCPMELLEVPSHILERLAMHPASLAAICGHGRSGQPLPPAAAEALARRIRAHWYSPVQYQQQVLTVLLDQLLHTAPGKASARQVAGLWQSVWARHAAAPGMLVTCQQARALHKVAADHGRAYGYSYAWYLATAFWRREVEPVVEQLCPGGRAAVAVGAAGDAGAGSCVPPLCPALLELLQDGASLPPQQLAQKHWPELVMACDQGRFALRVDADVVAAGLSMA
jgi:intermediate peptidase